MPGKQARLWDAIWITHYQFALLTHRSGWALCFLGENEQFGCLLPPSPFSHLIHSPLFSISVLPNGGWVVYICGSLGRKLGAQLGVSHVTPRLQAWDVACGSSKLRLAMCCRWVAAISCHFVFLISGVVSDSRFPVHCEDMSHRVDCLMLLEDIPNPPLCKVIRRLTPEITNPQIASILSTAGFHSLILCTVVPNSRPKILPHAEPLSKENQYAKTGGGLWIAANCQFV